jgi:hypothetical protein
VTRACAFGDPFLEQLTVEKATAFSWSSMLTCFEGFESKVLQLIGSLGICLRLLKLSEINTKHDDCPDVSEAL